VRWIPAAECSWLLPLPQEPNSGHCIATIGDDTSENEANRLTYENDDVAKLHACRDALPAVRSAGVLYPGKRRPRVPGARLGALRTMWFAPSRLCPGATSSDLLGVLKRIFDGREGIS
jgi:hypothetical protein